MTGIIVWYIAIVSQFNIVFMLNLCESQQTCQGCLADPNLCAWCAANEYNGPRCILADSMPENWCPGHLNNPKKSLNVPPLHNEDFSSKKDNYVQIKPQSYNIRLRPGETVNFNFTFKGSDDYPVDLYFLLDASTTMKDYKQQTAAQSIAIYNNFTEMTDNVFLGLGTFIDKNVLPFSSVLNSSNTYSFMHLLTLGDDFERFRDTVADSPNGINRDSPEGGLDALAQVLVCKDIVGWRKESTKIVVFLTDSPSHVAGDGKAAGIFKPYDGKCYTENNIYTMEKEMDYPSLGMINKLASENKVIILFAVNNQIYDVYKKLNKAISGSKTANIEQSSKDVIVKILKKIYQDITQNIKLKVNYKAGIRRSFDLSISPDCVNTDIGCASSPGEEHVFEGTIRMKDNIPVDNTEIDIMVEGITQKFVLNITVNKECECQKNMENNSSYCNNGGTRQCGICQCDSSRYGPTCACEKDKNNPTNDNSTCIAPGTSTVCSGHGSCICGICHCTGGFECNYCQYHSKSCGSNGHSECGECRCNPGYTGNTCECNSVADDRCSIDKDSKRKCNNRGKCICNKCVCQKPAKWDKRHEQDDFCEMKACSGCADTQCRALEPCVLCKFQGNDCPADACDPEMRVQLVDTLSNDNDTSISWTKCNSVRVSVGCSTPFLYRYDYERYGILVMVQKNKNCATTYYWTGGALLLSLLIGGIGVLIGWKVWTNMRDHREYQEFLKKNRNDIMEMTVNPIFKSPCVQVDNPGFRKRSLRST